MDHRAIHTASLQLADVLTEMESLVLSQPESEERRRLMRAIQRLASLADMELRLPLEKAMEDMSQSRADRADRAVLRVQDHGVLADSPGIAATTIDEIDAYLRDACTDQWRQAARVTGTAVAQWPDLPIALFAERLLHLSRTGTLESRGDLTQVLHSEVRRLRS